MGRGVAWIMMAAAALAVTTIAAPGHDVSASPAGVPAVARVDGPGPASLPDGLAPGGDLRGTYRAAFCSHAMLTPGDCGRLLRRFAGETTTPLRRVADAERYRLLFVPGFLAACFPHVHSFADMIDTARTRGFQAEALAVGGRDGVAANARSLAEAVDRLPADGRRLVFVAHSKGALDTFAMLGARPDIAARTAAVLTIAGALRGSPLADDLRSLYAASFAWFPFAACPRGDGDPLADLSPSASRDFWGGPAGRSGVPVYTIAATADLAGVSPVLLPTYLRLASSAGANDGMVPLQDQVAPGAALLGVVNADHLRVAIPFPGPAFVLLFNAEPFPRDALLLAALDVIAAQVSVRATRGEGDIASAAAAHGMPRAR